MSKYSNTVEYSIKTNLDSTGLQKLQSELTQIQTKLRTQSNFGWKKEIQESVVALQEFKTILNKSFNSKLGMLDLSKFNKQLMSSAGLVSKLNVALREAGAQGTIAGNNIIGRMYQLDTGLKSVSKTTDKIANTIGNTFRWGLIASAFATVMNSVHDAAKYTAELDKSLTNIMMVTQQSREEMNAFAKDANALAKNLGATTTQITEATKVFAQQGMNTPESLKMAEYSVHLANISEQDSATSADELTAMKNAFQLEIDDMGNAVSKWAAIANNAAVSMEELSVASQKAASVANTVGVDMDQFAGHIAAIEATTREAPENIGNGLKTLYSRFADIKLGETLEDGVDLGQFSSALKKVGVEVLDTSGQMRDVGAIIEDMMAKWGDLDQTQRNAVATTVAGRFQLARFEALMNSQDIYRTSIGAARGEQGTETYDRMQETYRESMEGRTKALQASVEEIFNNLFTTDSLYGFIDAAQGFVDVVNDLIESIGGGSTALSAFGLIFGQIFSTQISRGINNFISNRERSNIQQQNMSALQTQSMNVLRGNGLMQNDPRTAQLEQTFASLGKSAPLISAEQFEEVNSQMQAHVDAVNNAVIAEEQMKNVLSELGNELNMAGMSEEQFDKTLTELNKNAGLISENFGNAINPLNEMFGALRKAKIELSEFGEEIVEESTRIEILDNAFGTVDAKMDALWKNLSNLGKGKGFKSYIAEIEELQLAYEKLSQKRKKINQEPGKFSTTDVEAMNKALKELEKSYEKIIQKINQKQEKLAQQTTRFNQARGACEQYRQEEERTARVVQSTAQSYDRQNTINTITNLTMGVGQLAFAVQSFKSIGSIFENEDLSDGEKLVELIANLGFTLPMITMGVGQFTSALGGTKLGQGIKEVQQYKKSIEELKIAQQEATAATVEAEAAYEAAQKAHRGQKAAHDEVTAAKAREVAVTEELTVAEERAAVASETLKRSMLWMLGISAAIAAIAIPIGVMMAEAAKAHKEFEKDLEQSNQTVATINSQKSNYDDLYEEYKKTGKASDELKKSSIELGEALGVSGAEALANSGHFDSLNDSIQEATVSQLNYNAALLEQKRLESTGQTSIAGKRPGELKVDDYGNTYIDYSNSAPNEVILGQNEKQYKDYQKQIADLKVQLINAKAEGTDTTGIENEIKNYELLSKQVKLTTGDYEYLKIVKEEAESSFKGNLENGAYDSLGKEFGSDINKYRDFLKEADENVAREYNFLLNSAGEEAANAYLDSLIGLIAERLPEELRAVLEGSLTQAAGASTIDSAFAENLAKARKNKNLEDPNAYSAYQESYVQNSSDYQVQYDEYESQIAGIQAEDQALRENIALREERIEELEHGADLTEEEVKWTQQGTKATDKHNEIIKKDSDSISKNTSRIEELRKKQEKYKDSMKDLADHQLTVQDGFDQLTEAVENYQNASSEEEKAQHISSMQSALTEMTGAKEGTFDTNFVLDNLDKITEAAGGSKEAINELRAACAQEILVKARLDDNAKNIPQETFNLISEAQALVNGVEIGASIDLDNSGFIQHLIEIGTQAEDTGAYVSSVLSAIAASGVDFDLDLAEIENAITRTIQLVQAINSFESKGSISAETASNLRSGAIKNATGKLTAHSYGPLASGGVGTGGTGGSSCFIAGTLITLLNGFKNIEQIKQGDIVLSYNEELKRNEYSEVLQTMTHNVYEKIYTLHIDNEELVVTGIHRFFIKRNNNISWIHASNLQNDDLVLFADGTWHKINNITSILKYETVYNFEVSNNHNYYVGKNQILAHNKGSSGGSDKERQKKEKAEAQEVEYDAFRKTDAILNRLTDTYNKLNGTRDYYYATTKKHQKATTQEINNIERQNAVLKEQQKIAAGGIAMMKENEGNTAKAKARIAELKELAKANGMDLQLDGESINKYGLKTNEKGDIINEVAVFRDLKSKAEEAKQKWDDAIDIWNSDAEDIDVTEDDITDLEKKYDKAIQKIDDMKAATDEYNSLLAKSRELLEQIEENKRKIAEFRLDRWKEFLDVIERAEKKAEHLWYKAGKATGHSTDSPIRQAAEAFKELNYWTGKSNKAVKNFFNNMKKTAADKEEQAVWDLLGKRAKAGKVKSNPEDLLKFAKKQLSKKNVAEMLGGKDSQQYVDFFDTLEDKVYSTMESTESAIENITQKVIDLQQYMLDAAEKPIQYWEYQSKMADHIVEMIKLTRGEHQHKAILKVLKQRQQYAFEELKAEKERYKVAKANYDEVMHQYGGVKKLSDEEQKLIDDTRDKLFDAIDRVQDKEKAAAEAVKNTYEENFEKIKQSYEKKMFGGKSENMFAQEWEMATYSAEHYLDTVTQISETDKLRSKYRDMIDNANSLRTQQKITDQMEREVDYMKNKTKLSQFDVDLANARLTLLQKQIALEEAQKNKNQMRLRRDSQGNYSYVYSADNDARKKAEQELHDAEYEIYRMSKEEYVRLQNEKYNLEKTYWEKLEAIREEYAEQPKKQQKALEELNQWYKKEQNALSKDLKVAKGGMKEGVELLSTSPLTEFSDEFTKIQKQMETDWPAAMGNIGVIYSKEIENMTTSNKKFRKSINKTTKAILKMNKAYKEGRADVGKEGVFSRGNNGYGNLDASTGTELSQDIARGDNEIETDKRNTGKAQEQATEGIEQTGIQSGDNMKDVTKEYLLKNKKQEYQIARGTKIYCSKDGKQRVKKKKGKGKNYFVTTEKETITIRKADKNATKFGIFPAKQKPKPSTKKPGTPEKLKKEMWWVDPKQLVKRINEAAKQGRAEKFDTGGYTGQWGNEGRLAMLHEKELVLNANDTANMLAAVDVVRRIIEQVKTPNATTPSLGNVRQKDTSSDLKQQVSIEATFPNVYNAEDVRSALLSLEDDAAQYVFKVRG